MAYAKWAGDMLNRYYPGHAWHVEVHDGAELDRRR